MKQSMSYWDKKDAPKRVVLDKQEAVGRNWGESFDSGCNISGLRKIHICLGPYQKNESSYFIIKRISLEFDNPSHSDEKLEPFYCFADMNVNKKDTMRVFEFGNDDSVVRVDVWTDDRCVSAVQFCMESGAVSQLYGSHSNTPPNAFLRGGPCSKLVGIHGLYHGVIHKLGFTFAEVTYGLYDGAIDKLGFTFAEVTSTTHDGEDISTVTTTDGDYN
eukprot:CAMPEP_0168182126 /NCGR_PEP_ID=MMETSP0139_2-20121125/11678_1 /TAXON_ID=44445 /ORGANISM="Pseudo-nitzschia australis, Strain 10249 10 AB" /LENGTH=216 /DNA_ID=CAMNT_0008102937 /DNA_START=168 /DNA_END=818 /DNA_ORIENTATION=-